MFQVVEKPWKPVFRFLAVTKYDKAMFQGVARPCELIFYLRGIQKATWIKSRKWIFK
jgi:hypothetical protein